MDFKIVWHSKAIDDLEKIIIYLQTNWSTRIRNNFSRSLKDKLQTLKKFPLSGTASGKKHFRKKLITKHSYLVYKVFENRIEILFIKDTRQNTNANN
ncbi:MAG: type II toxin-antitoxin system RelE/ParE family toxin [Bacteroidetes bacterium]|nr:type II toxin-antitoxin system RelE/ParE family toxin [Bacteroidota bacterium]